VGEGVFGYFSDGRGGWSLSAGGVVQRWDEGSAGPAMEHRLPLHATELIRAARWWRRGGAQSLIVVGTTLGRLLCCDVRSGETSELRAADADPAPIMWIATRGDGLLFHQEGTEIVEWRPGQERRFACRPAVQGANDYVPLVGNLTRDGRRLVIGTTWGEVCFLDVEAGAPMQQQGPVELDGSPWVATWDAEGRSAFALTVVGSLYRVTPGGGAERLFALPSRGVGLNISNDGSLLAVGGADGLARILDREGRLLLTLSTGALRTSAFGTDNRELVTMTIAGECRTWPLQLTASGKELLESSPYQAAIARARAAVPATWVEPVDPIERYARLAAAGDPGAHAAGARYIDDAIETQAAPPLNRIAWRIVDPARPTAEAARDLDLAQRAAEAAVAISKRRNAAMLDTLARVYAWRGDFAQALAIQEEALQVLDRFPGTGTRANLERTLAEYRSRR
jgi:sugar lactone lactonase YvrE